MTFGWLELAVTYRSWSWVMFLIDQRSWGAFTSSFHSVVNDNYMYILTCTYSTVNWWIDNTWRFVYVVCVWLAVSIPKVEVNTKCTPPRNCMICAYSMCAHRQTHTHTFLSSLRQHLHSSFRRSATHRYFSILLQASVTMKFQWLVRHPSLAHWKETTVHTSPTVKKFDTINQLPPIRHLHTSTSVIQIRPVNARTSIFLLMLLLLTMLQADFNNQPFTFYSKEVLLQCPSQCYV